MRKSSISPGWQLLGPRIEFHPTSPHCSGPAKYQCLMNKAHYSYSILYFEIPQMKTLGVVKASISLYLYLYISTHPPICHVDIYTCAHIRTYKYVDMCVYIYICTLCKAISATETRNLSHPQAPRKDSDPNSPPFGGLREWLVLLPALNLLRSLN